ncbi:hypothetical protein [Microbacterium sp. ZW T5_56]|uniref:hypothetical protein n=1 Tax=Microbacterium sp. ZW T5_56 TaxID=3378081 RepID=UPI003854CE25
MNAAGADSTPVEKPRRRAWPAILDPRKNVHLNVFLRLAAAWLCLLGSGVVLYRLLFFPPGDRFSLTWSDDPFTPELLVTAVAFVPAAFAALAALSGPRRLLAQVLAIAMVSVGFALLAGSMLFVPGDAPRGTFVVIETAVIVLVYSTALLTRRDLWRRTPRSTEGDRAVQIAASPWWRRNRGPRTAAMAFVVVVIVAAAGVGVWMWNARDALPTRLGETVSIPATFALSSSSWSPDSDRGISVMIRQDGTAVLSRAPLGVLGTDEDGRSCGTERGTEFSGEGEWHLDSRGALQIDSDAGSLVLYPRRGMVGDTNWWQTRFFLCDGSSMNFSVMG